MTLVDRKNYMESEEYIEKRSKFTQRVGRQQQYCGMGWSAQGVKFYQDVWKKWKTISSVNKLNVWKKLEEGWEISPKRTDLDAFHILVPRFLVTRM